MCFVVVYKKAPVWAGAAYLCAFELRTNPTLSVICLIVLWLSVFIHYASITPSGDVPKHGESGELNVNTQALNAADAAIKAVGTNPATSDWLRSALMASTRRDTLDALNDAEYLVELLSARFNALLAAEHCGQFTRTETKGKDQPGQAFLWKGTRWVIQASTPNWVFAKPSGN